MRPHAEASGGSAPQFLWEVVGVVDEEGAQTLILDHVQPAFRHHIGNNQSFLTSGEWMEHLVEDIHLQ